MYTLAGNQKFELKNYQDLAPFSSFLPGIAGINGIPMWVFYVNRGQGIASFGIQDKNHAMMEFHPADKSYQLTQVQGFRTFIKWTKEDGTTTLLEPFSEASKKDSLVEEKMSISENMLELNYVHKQLGLTLQVEYFILPEAPVAALVRHVKLINTSESAKQIEIVDGLPAIFPSGVPHTAYKELGNTIKSWFDVANLEEGIPFYRLRGSIEDSSEVKEIHQGNFYYSISNYRNEEKVIKPIIDRDILFGTDTSLKVPEEFLAQRLNQLLNKPQHATNKVSCGFSASRVELKKNEVFQLFTVVGHAKTLQTVQNYVKENLSCEALLQKRDKATTITDEITCKVKTQTAQPLFDAYIRQSYLDNGLRGGFPITFEKDDKRKVYYLFSRKHGDLERDYNFFSISPTYYSQGNGNYRDINQNRRCDVLFDPKVEDHNVNMFLNLIQLDGYNPLSVKGLRFQLADMTELPLSAYVVNGEEKIARFFTNSFTPGELKHFVDEEGIQLSVPFETFLTDMLLSAEEVFQAEFGEGYWIDHWTYNLDLIDNYLAIFPDKESNFFFGRPYRFFDSPVRVKSRSEKYVFTENGKLRQYHANVKIKEKLEEAAKNGGNLWIRKNAGKGDIYETNLYSKLLLLSLVKASSMAPLGLGIEMEGDKPGWNDSLNGLPGMFGSSISELFELKRLIDLLLSVKGEGEICLPKEAGKFLTKTVEAMGKVDSGSEKSELEYWNRVTTERESYRDTIYQGISGEETRYSLTEAKEGLHVLRNRVEEGIERVKGYANELGLIPTYFYFEVKAETLKEPLDVQSLAWVPKPVTPFLEGIVKQLKLSESKDEAKQLYEKVKGSSIYDNKLGMYKTSMSIAEEPMELGRARSFTPGWLENESIFLHMAYKYLLATIQAGLAEEFFEDMQKALIPFLSPEVYGRSILENSSFIASSANPDPALHGRGFVSRLSGSTIEMMSMWFVMMAGPQPFTMKNGRLSCQLVPTLPGWMFDENGNVSFTFLGKIDVTYINHSKADTFGSEAVRPSEVELFYEGGQTAILTPKDLVGDIALAIREGKVTKMTIVLTK
ncbi:hypothetical protein MM221_08285 [Salipaludibacillus sp. LMS25]|jgi:hypothetical protein|uniref:hypothetical protein n=1 Tax=Salipaludibacillus sp. LMS25 TaxID=2924031 RepID=UPI0020D0E0BA|nr:hypothetical protein [Salipaludibacillus sp. LMS25]UTR16529.1 hypothetical protein MM221_08285 [Salipaludibacillus sp. LMS25]